MSLNPRVRQTAFAAAFLGASLLPMFSAAAQSMTDEKCRLFQSISKGVITELTGQVSQAFTDSVIQFIGADGRCARPAVFSFTEGTKDRDAMDKIRLLLIARQTAQARNSRPQQN